MLSQPVTGYETIQFQTYFDTQCANGRNVIDFWQQGSSTAAAPFSTNFATQQSVAGLATFDTSITAAPGVLVLETGTGATQGCAVKSAYSSYLLPTGQFDYQVRFQVPVLSDGTETYTLRFGVGATFGTSGDITNGIYAEYTHTLTNAAFRLRAASASVRTNADGVTTLTAGSYHWLQIVYDARQTFASLYLDDVLQATLTSGFPSNTSTMEIACGQIIKSAGTTTRQVWIDALFYGHAFSSAR